MDRDKKHIVHHDDAPTVGDEVGEAAGGISGVVLGAAVGSAGGPVGTIIGGIAGAVGGWWAGRGIAEAAKHFTNEDDAYYRNEYERSSNRLADQSYDQVRPAYQVGHLAGRNPDYVGKNFETIEPDLRQGWTRGAETTGRDWDQVKGYARDAYTRSSSSSPQATRDTDAAIDRELSRTPDRADDVYDRVDPNRTPLSPEGPDAAHRDVRP